jgi:hypothetical protein
MGAAEIIAFAEVRARKPWSTLRQQLHERLDQWLDTLAQRWPEPPSTLTEVTATVWDLRQPLTGGITEPGMGRSDDDTPVRRQRERRARRAQAHAAHVGRSVPSNCERLGVSQGAPGAHQLSPTSPWGLSVR